MSAPTNQLAGLRRYPGKDANRSWLCVFLTDDASVFVMTPPAHAVPARVLRITGTAALKPPRCHLLRFLRAYQSLSGIEGIDPLWCFAHIRDTSCEPSRSP